MCEKMYIEHKNLIRFIINKHYPYLKGTADYDDAFQNGSIGLLKAVKDFDPERGYKFSTYAYPAIQRSIHKGLYPFKSIMRVSRNANELHTKYFRYLNEGYEFDEIVEKLDTTPADLINIINAFNGDYLDRLILESEGIAIMDTVSDDVDIENDYERNNDLSLSKALCKLFLPDEYYFILFNFYNGVSQTDLGRILGRSQVTISRRLTMIENNVFPLFKEYMEGTIPFGELCLILLKGNKLFKDVLGYYLEYIFNLPDPPADFIKEMTDELDCWSQRDFRLIEDYFTRGNYSLYHVVDNLDNIVKIIDKHIFIEDIVSILLKYKPRKQLSFNAC